MLKFKYAKYLAAATKVLREGYDVVESNILIFVASTNYSYTCRFRILNKFLIDVMVTNILWQHLPIMVNLARFQTEAEIDRMPYYT